MEGSCRNPPLAQALRERLQELEIHTYSNSDHRTDHEPLEKKEEHLAKVLPLYIQVWSCGTAQSTYWSLIVRFSFSEKYLTVHLSVKEAFVEMDFFSVV